MYANWIPQNIHKRLLLYILQQLSLFSEVDLPNLEEVSLNNIHLKDISIDPEKVSSKIPGFNLRHGKLSNITLTGSVSDGVNFDISGAELVLAPSIENLHEDLKNAQVSLAQSTADLTQTVMLLGGPRDLAVIDDDSEGSPPEIPSSARRSNSAASADSARRRSSFGGVMSKAVEIALLRIQIRVTDLNIKLVIEPVDLLLHVDVINFECKNGVKLIHIKGLRVSTVKPYINPGHSVSSKPPSEQVSSDSEYSEDDDGYGDESLTDSMVFTHEEASSIYMSAAAESFKKKPETPAVESDSKHVVLFFIDSLKIAFEEMSPLTDLKVEIGKMCVSAVPLLPSLALVSNSLSKIVKVKNHQLKKKHFLERSQRKAFEGANCDVGDADPLASELIFLDKIHISTLIISLTLALDASGNFRSFENDLSLKFSNFTLKQKDSKLKYGGIERVEMIQYMKGSAKRMFFFDQAQESSSAADKTDMGNNISASALNAPGKAEIRFEHSNDNDSVSELTVLLSRPAVCELNLTSLLFIMNLSKSLLTVKESLAILLNDVAQMNEMLNGPETNRLNGERKTQVILQTASFLLTLSFAEDAGLRLFVLPITFNKVQDYFYVHRAVLSWVAGENESHVVTIPSIKVNFEPQHHLCFAFSNSLSIPKRMSSQCLNNISVGDISGSVSHELLQLLKAHISNFSKCFSSASEDVNCLKTALSEESAKRSVHTSNNFAHSMYSTQGRLRRMKGSQIIFGENHHASSKSSWRVAVKLIMISISDVSRKFGNLEIEAKLLDINIQSGVLTSSLSTLHVFRKHDTIKQDLIYHIPQESARVPLAQVQLRSKDKRHFVEFVLRDLMFDYYTLWIAMLQNPDSRSKKANVKDNGGETDAGGKTSFRVFFIGLAFGINPGRLNSKLCLAAERGALDMSSMSNQFEVKSSFREVHLLLVDDASYLTRRKRSSNISIHSYLLSEGYSFVGLIKNLHIGVSTVNDSSKVSKSQIAKNIRPNVELKVNADELSGNLCADSAYTFLQLSNDLKEPEVFNSEEMFKVRLPEDFHMPGEILQEIDLIKELHERNLSISHNIKKSSKSRPEGEMVSRQSGTSKNEVMDSSVLQVVEGHFVEKEPTKDVKNVPLAFELNLSKVELFFFDGYDWHQTRKAIRKALQTIEERKSKKKESKDPEESMETTHSEANDTMSDLLTVTSLNEIAEGPEQEQAVGETLFESIHISAKKGVEMSSLVDLINLRVQNENRREEAGSHPNVKVEKEASKLRISRSRNHKVSVDVRNVTVKVISFSNRDPRFDSTPEDLDFERMSKVEVQLDTLTIYDNVMTSTWNKVLTYMSSLGEREIGNSMLKLGIESVRPDPKLPFTEAIINISLLPVRLHVDQDTLDFLVRFFGFQDSRFALPRDETLYIQKLLIDALRVKFDYKPKKVDFAGIRSGNNAEFANFFILDGSDISLTKGVIYGAHGFANLSRSLAKLYGPRFQRSQISGLLAGLPPIKSVFNLSNGVKDLIAIPVNEYKQEGRVLRGLQKGTKSFAKNTTYELLRLGVKVASGTQVLLENSEQYFGGEGVQARKPKKPPVKEKPIPSSDNRRNLLETSQVLRGSVAVDNDPYTKQKLYIHALLDETDEFESSDMTNLQTSIIAFDQSKSTGSYDDDKLDETGEETKLVSLYSNQPENSKEGLKLAYQAMSKNLSSAGKKIEDLRRQLQNTGTLGEQLEAIAKSSPVIVIRPMIGTSEAVMKALIGFSNEIDSKPMRESHDKYRIEKPDT